MKPDKVLARSSKGQKPSTTSVRDFQSLLRSSGLRSTAPRIAVLECLHASNGPNSHKELFDALEDRGFNCATIYRNLMALTHVGIVRRTDLGGVWRFELVRGVSGVTHRGDHPHFVCTDCGQISCLPGLPVTIGWMKGSPRAVVKNNVEVQLKGRCDKCG